MIAISAGQHQILSFTFGTVFTPARSVWSVSDHLLLLFNPPAVQTKQSTRLQYLCQWLLTQGCLNTQELGVVTSPPQWCVLTQRWLLQRSHSLVTCLVELAKQLKVIYSITKDHNHRRDHIDRMFACLCFSPHLVNMFFSWFPRKLIVTIYSINHFPEQSFHLFC